MKILQISNKAPFPANDGSSIAISNLAEGLADNGIELHLLCINTKKHFKPDSKVSEDFKVKTNYQSVFKDTNTSAIGALLNLFSSQSYFVSRFFFKDFEQALTKKLTDHTFDIVQLEGVFMASYIPLIKKHSKALIALRAHNVEHQIWERHIAVEQNWIKKQYLNFQNKRLKKFELQAFNSSDVIICITNEDEKNIKSLIPKLRTHTTVTGINLEKYNAVNSAKKQQTIFHFASMDWLPNIEAVDWLLNNVWESVLKQMPNTELILAGRGMPKRLKELKQKNVTIIENVESSHEFYNYYDIMLVPLFSGSGLRIKLVEGLAFGKAIVTTSIGAEGINYTNGKDLLIADNPQEFVNAVVKLLSSDDIKNKLQHNARQLAENQFDYLKVAKELIEFYKTQIHKG